MKATRKAKFKSLSTPGVMQDLSNYLVELAFLRSNSGIRLPAAFWNQTKYKFRYRREIQACRKFIKTYGEAAVLKVAMENYVSTWTDFATLEVYLQKFKESRERLALPKDLSRPKIDFVKESVDVRTTVPEENKSKNLFKRLEELNGKEG